MNPFEVYSSYVALHNHFSSRSYDYFRYNGKSRVTKQSWEKRRDQYVFKAIAKQKDPVLYMLANIVMGEKWIGDFTPENLTGWQRKIESLGYLFEADINRMDDNFNTNFIVKDNQLPKVITLYYQREIHLETLIILLDLTNTMSYYMRVLNKDVLWDDLSLMVMKYTPFLKKHYEKSRFANLAMKRWKGVENEAPNRPSDGKLSSSN